MPLKRPDREFAFVQQLEVPYQLLRKPAAADVEADLDISFLSGLREIGGGNEDMFYPLQQAFCKAVLGLDINPADPHAERAWQADRASRGV